MNMKIVNEQVPACELAVGDWVIWSGEACMVGMGNLDVDSDQRIGVILISDVGGKVEFFHPTHALMRLRVVITI